MRRAGETSLSPFTLTRATTVLNEPFIYEMILTCLYRTFSGPTLRRTTTLPLRAVVTHADITYRVAFNSAELVIRVSLPEVDASEAKTTHACRGVNPSSALPLGSGRRTVLVTNI